jgi:hypothetical protein
MQKEFNQYSKYLKNILKLNKQNENKDFQKQNQLAGFSNDIVSFRFLWL